MKVLLIVTALLFSLMSFKVCSQDWNALYSAKKEVVIPELDSISDQISHYNTPMFDSLFYRFQIDYDSLMHFMSSKYYSQYKIFENQDMLFDTLLSEVEASYSKVMEHKYDLSFEIQNLLFSNNVSEYEEPINYHIQWIKRFLGATELKMTMADEEMALKPEVFQYPCSLIIENTNSSRIDLYNWLLEFTVANTTDSVLINDSIQITIKEEDTIYFLDVDTLLSGAKKTLPYTLTLDSPQISYSIKLDVIDCNAVPSRTLLLESKHDYIKQELTLYKGWNLICFYVNIPIEMNSVDSVFKEHIADLDSIYSDSLGYGKTGTHNTLSTIESGKAYWIKATKEISLNKTGILIKGEDKTFSLKKGSNMVAYPFATSRNIREGLSSVLSNIKQVKDGNGNVFNPTLKEHKNTLHKLLPGKAYWVIVKEDCELTF